jgi:hypothetical protein
MSIAGKGMLNPNRSPYSSEEIDVLYQQIAEPGKIVIAEAIEHHRKSGELFSFAVSERLVVWQDGKMLILEAVQKNNRR